MSTEEEPINYCTAQNGAQIQDCSSQSTNCPVNNIIQLNRKQIWLSEEGLPQYFIIDLSKLIERPKFFKCIGFDCWHDYNSNPAVIELLVSTDDQSFVTWYVMHSEQRTGLQLFSIDPLGKRYNFIKVVVKETFGASKVYMNQIFLFEENPMAKMKRTQVMTSMSDSDVYMEQNQQLPQQQQQQQRVNIPRPVNNDKIMSQSQQVRMQNKDNQQMQIHTSESKKYNQQYDTLNPNIYFSGGQQQSQHQQSNQRVSNWQDSTSDRRLQNYMPRAYNEDLSNKINSMHSEVSQIMQQNKFTKKNENFADEDDFNSLPQINPILTTTEKDVKEIKRNLQLTEEKVERVQNEYMNLETVVLKLQDNVSFLVERVQDLQLNMESIQAQHTESIQTLQKNFTDRNQLADNAEQPQSKYNSEMQKQDESEINVNEEYLEKKISEAVSQKMEQVEKIIQKTLQKSMSQVEDKLKQKQKIENPSESEKEKYYDKENIQSNKMRKDKNKQYKKRKDSDLDKEDFNTTTKTNKHGRYDSYAKNDKANQLVEKLQEKLENKAQNNRVSHLLEKLQDKLELRQLKLQELLSSSQKKRVKSLKQKKQKQNSENSFELHSDFSEFD